MRDDVAPQESVAFRYPRYSELPEELMFARDLVAYVNHVHAALPSRVRRGKVFTCAMAGNYVKRGLTPPALGRRYDRDHLALILFAATAKLCFSTEEVFWLANELFVPNNIQASHDCIAYAFEKALAGNTAPGRAGAVANALCDRMRALSS